MDPLNPEKASTQTLANLVPLHPPPLQTSHPTQGKIGGTTFFFLSWSRHFCKLHFTTPAQILPLCHRKKKKKRLTNQDEWCQTFQAQTSQPQLSLVDTLGSGRPQLVPHQWSRTSEATGPGIPEKRERHLQCHTTHMAYMQRPHSSKAAGIFL